MGAEFDKIVDAARQRLEAARAEPVRSVNERQELLAILPVMTDAFASRRLSFKLGEDDGDAAIDIVHVSGEQIGAVRADGDELVFDSADPDYFEDVVGAAADNFIEQLYQSLKRGMPQFELDLGS